MIIVFNQLKKKSGRLQRSGSELSDSKITSSASSSKRSADSTNLLEPDAADMYDIDTCLERDVNSQKKSRKTSKISRDDLKHHKKTSSTTKSSASVLQQYYKDKIEQFEAENWRISARNQFDKVYSRVLVATRDGFKRHYFPKNIFYGQHQELESYKRRDVQSTD